MKRIFLLVIAVLILAQNVCAADYIPYTSPACNTVYGTADVKIAYPNGEARDAVFINGRLYVPLNGGVELMGGEVRQTGNIYKITIDSEFIFLSPDNGSRNPKLTLYGSEPYISMYTLAESFGYSFKPDVYRNTASVMKNNCLNARESLRYARSPKPAYIRLEDITADGMRPSGKGKYTVDMLEKLRFMAEYLYARNQEYYIAWIPVYACPAENYWNDVSADTSLYNAYFIYVLDYMTEHGGHLGLHGYTHQYNNEESCIGYEWGRNTPYNTNEQQKRMIKAKQCCERLGYKEEFFEFPHYGADHFQLLMAEHYFDAVYQPYPDRRLENNLTYTERSGKRVFYIPTPADYVHNTEDNSIYGKMEDCVKNGYTLSLYFHPVIDRDMITTKTENNTRLWAYSAKGALPHITDKAVNMGYGFTAFGR